MLAESIQLEILKKCHATLCFHYNKDINSDIKLNYNEEDVVLTPYIFELHGLCFLMKYILRGYYRDTIVSTFGLQPEHCYKYMTDWFPVLNNYVKDKDDCDYWYPRTVYGLEQRIELLDKCINELMQKQL